jgi:hypothetical protein
MKYQIIITAECPNITPAHQRYITKTGEGSSIRTAATDALDKVFRDDKIKALRNKLPIKVVIQHGGEVVE